MIDGWISAIFGLVGTLVGGGLTFYGQRLTMKQQTKTAGLERASDAQRAAATQLLSAADMFIAEAEALRVAINSANDDAIRLSYPRYYQQWCEFMRSRAAVAVSASGPINEAGVILLDAVNDLTETMDLWYETGAAPGGKRSWQPRYNRIVDGRTRYANTVRTEQGQLDGDRRISAITAPARPPSEA